jgi:hypothetical protein
VYLLSEYLRAIEISEFSDRLAAVEKKVMGGDHSPKLKIVNGKGS